MLHEKPAEDPPRRNPVRPPLLPEQGRPSMVRTHRARSSVRHDLGGLTRLVPRTGTRQLEVLTFDRRAVVSFPCRRLLDQVRYPCGPTAKSFCQFLVAFARRVLVNHRGRGGRVPQSGL